MKVSIVALTVFTLVFSTKSLAQNNSWSISALSYLDDPAIVNLVEGDIKLIPQNNFGQIYCIERNFNLGSNIGFLFGFNTGYSSSTFIIDSIQGEEVELKINKIKHIGIHTGLFLTHSFSKNINIQLKIRGGLLYYKKHIDRISEYDPSRYDDIFMQDSNFSISTWMYPAEINSKNKRQLFIHPEINFSYNFKKIPLGISVGTGLIYSPKTIIEGQFKYYRQTFESLEFTHYVIDDALNAIGISMSVHYRIETKN